MPLLLVRGHVSIQGLHVGCQTRGNRHIGLFDFLSFEDSGLAEGSKFSLEGLKVCEDPSE